MYKGINLKEKASEFEKRIRDYWAEENTADKSITNREGDENLCFLKVTNSKRQTRYTSRDRKSNQRLCVPIQNNARLSSEKKSRLGYTWLASRN